MIVEIKMPRMGQSMEEGRIVEWLVNKGDQIDKGDPIVEIETDKSVITYESETSGILTEIIIPSDQIVPVGTTIAIVEDREEETHIPITYKDEKQDEDSEDIAQKYLKKSANSDNSIRNGSSKSERIKASPVAKRLAKDLGVDLSKITGSGPNGMIMKEDIHDYSQKLKSVPEKTTFNHDLKAITLSKIKRATAERMIDSKRSIPHFYVSIDIDFTEALRLRESLNRRGEEISITDLFIRGAVLSFGEHPNLNANFIDNQIHILDNVDMAIAVSVDDGLLTPVIKNCEQLSLISLSKKTKAAISRARSKTLTMDDIDSGTFTISNLGMYGIREFSAIINPPQVAILAVGSVQQTPIFDDNKNLTSRSIVNVFISADHRVLDGVEVALFLQELKNVLEDGYLLL